MVESNNCIKISNHFYIFLHNKLGNGAFGEIYLGKNIKTGQDVAIKVESRKTKHPQLLQETKLLKELQGEEGVPKIYYYSQTPESNCLVMELLGDNLEQLFNNCKRKFSLKTTLIIGLQLLERVELIHNHKIIHRDMKPDNFLIGKGDKKNTIFLIDMGLSKKYIDPITEKHIPFKDGKSLTGTVRYASIFTHLGLEQSRRDDIEGLSYILVYFMKGALPWNSQKAKNKKEKYQKIMEKKMNTPVDELCKGLPDIFGEIVYYPRKLTFEEAPNYEYLRGLMKSQYEKENFDVDYKYDWTINEKVEESKEEIKEEKLNNIE